MQLTIIIAGEATSRWMTGERTLMAGDFGKEAAKHGAQRAKNKRETPALAPVEAVLGASAMLSDSSILE